jgi:hypothetical protein
MTEDTFDHATDPTIGDSPILDEAPTVTIAGKAYQLRRLGVRDTFAIARIVAVGAAAMNRPLGNSAMSDPSALAPLLLSGLMAAEETTMKLLASVIDVTVPELEQMPMEAPLEIVAALAEHQDLRAFFARAGELMQRLPEMQTRSRAAST